MSDATRLLLPLCCLMTFLSLSLATRADTTPQILPFSQNWSNISLINNDHDWAGVPGLTGHPGEDFGSFPGGNPQLAIVDGSGQGPWVYANQSNPAAFVTGGVGEFEITDPVVALQPSGSFYAPMLVLRLNTTGTTVQQAILVQYDLRDIDDSADDAIQPVALQYRLGTTGFFTNIPAAFVADATTGPSMATFVTHVSVLLPPAANNHPHVQIRWITANAVGEDEWVGIDNISVTSIPTPRIDISRTNNLNVTILHWPTQPASLRLEYKTNLNTVAWLPFTGPLLTNGVNWSALVTNTIPARFFRVRQE